MITDVKFIQLVKDTVAQYANEHIELQTTW